LPPLTATLIGMRQFPIARPNPPITFRLPGLCHKDPEAEGRPRQSDNCPAQSPRRGVPPPTKRVGPHPPTPCVVSRCHGVGVGGGHLPGRHVPCDAQPAAPVLAAATPEFDLIRIRIADFWRIGGIRVPGRVCPWVRAIGDRAGQAPCWASHPRSDSKAATSSAAGGGNLKERSLRARRSH